MIFDNWFSKVFQEAKKLEAALVIPSNYESYLPEFEITHVSGDPGYVKVLDEFQHHFTGETMRYLRLETYGQIFGHGFAEYMVANEQQFEDLCRMRVEN